MEASDSNNNQTSNVVKISNTARKSLFFYVDLTCKFLKEQDEVTLSGLGYAISRVVTVAEILKNQGVVVTNVYTTMMNVDEERKVRKPKIEITTRKSEQFAEIQETKETLSAENQEIREAMNAANQSLQERFKAEIVAK
eukprot:TRINITY_DN11754_c0_g1_i1.p1 TRINITY_DN11754_c0_g1~~TRINITY_DN11754_c0_g1_i1.p1  ORF type:complete len:139 (+),score=29.84 TRINITY_DN11754_c0_g1_i1:28-444(+)